MHRQPYRRPQATQAPIQQMEDVWDFDFLPPGLGWTDLADVRQKLEEYQQVSEMLPRDSACHAAPTPHLEGRPHHN